MTPLRGGSAFRGGLVALAVAVAITSCGKSSGDDDDDSGSAGEGAGTSGSGGSSAVGGASHAGNGTGATNEGGSGARAGSPGSGGVGPDVGGGSAVGGAPGGGSSGTGSGGVNAGGANESGAAGELGGAAGAGCPGGDCSSTCGDGIIEGRESCEDGNVLPFDGCSADCRIEPECAGGACQGSCGDGIVAGGEACDDGNRQNGDGCSSECTVEGGYTCSAAQCDAIDGKCTLRIPAVFRDFNASTATGGHPDFAPGYSGNGAVQGLVEATLDVDGKPVLSAKADSSAAGGFMHGQTAFAEWYRDGGHASKAIPSELVLWDDGSGGYVNRWGKNGEQWQAQVTEADYGTVTVGLSAGLGCSSPDYPDEGCVPGENQECYDPCIPFNSTTVACCADHLHTHPYDGNPLFFPLDGALGTLTETRGEGKIPSQYGWNGFPWESDVAVDIGVTTPIQTATALFPSDMHDFHFTSEVKFWFVYTDALAATLDFTGDDDVWVFLNGHLAVDLGAWHIPLNGTLTIDAGALTSKVQLNANDDGTTVNSAIKNATAADYGLTNGNVYQIQIFHAERQPNGSTFKFGIHGLNVTRSTCVKN